MEEYNMDLLEVSNLEKSFSRKKIIKNVNFNISEGEIVGFVGPNGAGKTTTLKLITNLIFPDKGEIKINGYDLHKDREKALNSIASIIENPGLYTYLSGLDNLEYIRKIRGCSKEKMNSLIKEIGLENRIKDKVKKYSLGMKQRLALGMCLLGEPKLLILDEPTNGLDPEGTMELRNLIEKLAKEQKTSILFSSHLLSEVEKISDRIIFIKDGQIISIRENNKVNACQDYKITVENVKKAFDILNGNVGINELKIYDDQSLIINIKKNTIGEILKILTINDIVFYDVQKNSLIIEEVYNEVFKEQEL